MVICKIKDQSHCIEQHILPTKLIIRQSCGGQQESPAEDVLLANSKRWSSSL